MPLGGFFALVIAGIFAGFVYEVAGLVKLICKHHILAVIILDFVAAIGFGALFVLVEYFYLDFNVTFLSVLFFALGICLERISLGFLLAKFFRYIYNEIAKVLFKFKTTRVGKKVLK